MSFRLALRARSLLLSRRSLAVRSPVASIPLFAALLLAPVALRAVQLVPGVYGYGADRAINSAGFGAGATIHEVTNLSDGPNPGPPGSLRAALRASGPRIVVFRTSGVIELQSAINIENGNVTIAGQTAPSPGIAIHGAGLNFTASNVLVQHLRIRPGDKWSSVSTTNRDAISFTNSTTTISNAVFDHCTFSWTLDELASTWYSWDNVTFHKCIFAEPLHVSIHLDEGTFSPNVPQLAENLTSTKSPDSITTTTTSSPHAIGGQYQLVDTTADEQWIEYVLPIASSSSARGQKHLTIVGIKGPDRARFRAEIRDPNNNVILNSGEIVDQYGAPAQHTYTSQQNLTQSFTIPANARSLKVRLIVSGRDPSSTGWKLGIDQISITDGHGFGPLFSAGGTGGGKLAFIGNIMAHTAGRGPWSASKEFYYANNVLYNRSWQGMHLGHSNWPNFPMRVAVLGNTFIEGRDISASSSLPSPVSNTAVPANSQIYVGAPGDNAYNYGDRASPPPMIAPNLNAFLVGADPTTKTAGLSGVTPLPPASAYAATLLDAGARPADRDAFELRIVNEIADGAAMTALASRPGSIKHTVADAGGWPSLAANLATWTYPSGWNPHADDSAGGFIAGNGYTSLEEWLHALAADVERRGTGERPPPPGDFLRSTGDARLTNLSSRVAVGGVAGTPAPGFVLAGDAEKTLLLRAVGPALTNFGVANALADPRLRLLENNTTLATNDDWLPAHAATMTAAGAFQLPTGSRDAALVATLRPGAYTAPIAGADATPGIALLELYDPAAAGSSTTLVNASTRAYVGTGDAVLVPGFVVSGSGTLRVLIRAIGPSLRAFGVTDALADPHLALSQGTTLLATNDDWSSGNNVAELQAVTTHVGAFPLATGTRDAALLASLPAGAYTLTISGNATTTGTALFELYVVR